MFQYLKKIPTSKTRHDGMIKRAAAGYCKIDIANKVAGIPLPVALYKVERYLWFSNSVEHKQGTTEPGQLT